MRWGRRGRYCGLPVVRMARRSRDSDILDGLDWHSSYEVLMGVLQVLCGAAVEELRLIKHLSGMEHNSMLYRSRNHGTFTVWVACWHVRLTRPS